MRPPGDTRLPDGFTAVLDHRVQVVDGSLDGPDGGGAVLLGGSPAMILRLTPAARRLLRDGRVVVRDRVSAALARRLLDAGLAVPVPPAVRTPPPVTVVVPVRDNATGLERLLGALRATCDPHEVLVVDDGSADPAAVAAVAGRHQARLLRHRGSRGPAAARNTGLAAATTPLVAFCDSDVVPGEPGWLAALSAHFADPALALAAPRIRSLDTGDACGPGWIGDYERVRSSLDLGPDPGPVRPTSAVAYVPSAAMVVRAGAVGRGFDPRLRVAEDVDLVFRLQQAGWRLRYLPEITVAHEHRTALRPWLARKAFYGTGAAPLAARHPGQVPPVRLAPWTALACGLVLAQRRWSVLAAAAVTVLATVRLSRSLAGLRRRGRLAARLAAKGLGGAAWQSAAALVRHWWPAAASACLVSRRARRAVAVAACAEGVADWWWRGRQAPLLRYLLAHRLDDLAYGAGLWRGVLRQRTVAPLLPRVVRRTRPGGRSTAGPPRRRAGPMEHGMYRPTGPRPSG